jgi:transposase
MWTAENCGIYDRKGLRYPSDLTDEEWAIAEPHLPSAAPAQPEAVARPARRPQRHSLCAVDGVSVARFAEGFSAEKHWHDYFVDWHVNGTLTKLHHALCAEIRESVGKAPTPTTSIVDSQSVKSAEKGGPRSIRQGMMPVRKSKERSAISRSIRGCGVSQSTTNTCGPGIVVDCENNATPGD